MNTAVLGTGMVGTTIGTKLVQLGHAVKIGSRTKGNDKAAQWAAAAGSNASYGTFADAAAFGEMLFNCTHGVASIDALTSAGSGNLSGKILVDVSNPLDFSKGMPPSLAICNTDSLGERIQRTCPGVKVVKTLNTVNCRLMVNPSLVAGGNHDLFICGNDAGAKAKVTEILKNWFGWKSVIDLGDITGARTMEMLLPFWVRLMGVYQSPQFNFKIMR